MSISRSLLGRPLSDGAIQAFMASLASGGDPCTVVRYPDCEYHNWKSKGLSLCFDRTTSTGSDSGSTLVLGAIHVFAAGVDGYQQCKLQLPDGLSLDLHAKQVVQLLGEPEGKLGGRTVPITLVYRRRGVQIGFRLSSWEDAENPVASITFFAPT